MKERFNEMQFLYTEESIAAQFSEEKFRTFIQEDIIFPLQGVKKIYKKNDWIILEEGEINEVYFIESGHVAAIKDEEKIVDFFAKEDVLGLANLLLDSKSEYSFQVISNELTVTKYEKSDIIEKVINTQEGYFYHYVHMQKQVERMMEKEELLRLPSEQRISLALYQLVTKFGEGTGKENMACFPKQISKGMIAQYTSMNPNTVTNVVQKLEEEEIIYPIRRTIHVDMFKLEMKLEEIL